VITDRTEQDVARWKELRDKGWAGMTDAERSEWGRGMKGCYSYKDMNRVESAVETLSNKLVTLGYLKAPLSVYTTWSRGHIPFENDMTRYFGNIATLRKSLPVYHTTPEAPTIDQPFNYERANDIEKILVDLEEIITKLSQSVIYAGEKMSGEV
jgi:hypothetical protein